MQRLAAAIKTTVAHTAVVDIHTHLYDPGLGPNLLWGIDELLTYHYLVAELFRARPDVAPEAFWQMSKASQADLIWEELFVKRTPLSEACRGVITVLAAFDLPTKAKNLTAIRRYFAGQRPDRHVDRVLQLARVRQLYMTNDPLDPQEGPRWQRGFPRDPRFLAVLRLDSVLLGWPEGAARLRALGHDPDEALTGHTIACVRRYLDTWARRLEARYFAVSLPPGFAYPDVHAPVTTLLTKAVIPTARELGLPVALMIGVRKLVNPALRLAGDAVGRADTTAVERLAADFPDVRFLVTMLARENQHELAVAARKFGNLLPFGCWWFLNTPGLITEITRLRLELLGATFVPQHSDARVLEQLIYKWTHSRAVLARVLAEAYSQLVAAGRPVTRPEIERDVRGLLAPVI